MAKCRISVSFDEENFFWVVVGRDIFIRNPTKEDLMGTKLRYYNETNICPRCKEECEKDRIELTDRNILCPGKAYREKDKDGKETGRWICDGCYRKDRYVRGETNSNMLTLIGNRRTGNLDPNSTHAFGDSVLELACILYGWKDLNIENDNYASGTPVDCYDPKTGLYYQVRGKRYDARNGWWSLSRLEGELGKKYESMVFFCFDKGRKIVERIYKFPLKEIMSVKGITIYKNILSLRGSWVERYRITDKEELKKVNKIWKEIIMEK